MDTGKCITNMINTRAGEHCLFRSFGMGDVVDRVGKLRRADIANEIVRWYPQVKQIDVQQSRDGVYHVSVSEV